MDKLRSIYLLGFIIIFVTLIHQSSSNVYVHISPLGNDTCPDTNNCCGNLTNPCQSIKYALTLIEKGVNGTIILANGTYSGENNRDIDIPDSINELTLMSGSPSTTPIIDLDTDWSKTDKVRFMELSESTTKLEVIGLSFENFKLTFVDLRYINTSMISSPHHASEVLFTNCTFKRSTARLIYISPQTSALKITNCSFTDVSIFGSRYNSLFPTIQVGTYKIVGSVVTAVFIEGLYLDNSYVEDNDGPFLYVSGAIDMYLNNSIFQNTMAKFAPVFLDPIFNQSVVGSDDASNGHSSSQHNVVYPQSEYQVNVEKSIFQNLSARVIGRPSGSALDIRAGYTNFILKECLFFTNNLSQAINVNLWQPSNGHFVDCHFIQNACNTSDNIVEAGAINFQKNVGNCNIYFDNTHFHGNCALNSGGAITSQFDASSSTTMTNCTFVNNKSRFNGGHISTNGGTFNIIDCQFTNGSSSKGGAISLIRSNLHINNTVMQGNQAPLGSSLYCERSKTFIDNESNFSDNGHGSVFCYFCSLYNSPACQFWNTYTILMVTFIILAIVLGVVITVLYKYYKRRKKSPEEVGLINEDEEK